jgi:hypothetical protein
MKIYFYAAGQHVPDLHFMNLFEAVKDLGEVIVLKNNLSINLHLSLSLQHDAVMILYAANKQELDELVAIRGIFYDFRVILVLPDMQGNFIRKGHLLKPSYLTHIKGDIAELQEVIRKIASTCGSLIHKERQGFLQGNNAGIMDENRELIV